MFRDGLPQIYVAVALYDAFYHWSREPGSGAAQLALLGTGAAGRTGAGAA
jgi:hypothetical protein